MKIRTHYLSQLFEVLFLVTIFGLIFPVTFIYFTIVATGSMAPLLTVLMVMIVPNLDRLYATFQEKISREDFLSLAVFGILGPAIGVGVVFNAMQHISPLIATLIIYGLTLGCAAIQRKM